MLGNPRAIGRYSIRERLGSGGFATVYRAYDPVLDRQVALKVLHPHLSEDRETRERFIAEGRTLAGIRHRNIVQVFDAGTADGLVYLAMELVEGRSLATLMRSRGAVGVAQVVAIAEQAAAALDALHEHGLVHSDVKPANILVEHDGGRAVLLDFGVSRRIDDTLTQAGWIWGTPAFMAPEQLESGRRISKQTDIYQLAATIYALLAGEPPFTGEPAQIMYAVVHHQPPDLAARRTDVSPQFAAAIARAMAKQPDARPNGAGRFVQALHHDMPPDTLSSGDATRTSGITPPVAPAGPLTADAWSVDPPDGEPQTSRAIWATERLDHRQPAATPARPPFGRRGRSRGVAAVAGTVAAAILLGVTGIIWMRDGGDNPTTAGIPESTTTGLVLTPSPSPTATPTPTPTPQRSATPAATRTPTPTPTRPTPTPIRRPASAAAEGVAGLIEEVMTRRGYRPSGPVTPVPLSRNAVMYVQRGDGADGQRLFIFVNDSFVGTDWEDASPDGVSNPRVIGTGRFVVTYERDDGPPVPIVFTMTDDGLRPSGVAPGHCLPTTGC